MARCTLAGLLLLTGCSHDLDVLRGTGGDAGPSTADGGAVDADPVPDGGDEGDAGPPPCIPEGEVFASAMENPMPTAEIALGRQVLQYWRFEVTTPTTLTGVGFHGRGDAPSINVRGGIFVLDDDNDIPDGVDITTPDVATAQTGAVRSAAPSNIRIRVPVYDAAPGWYAVGFNQTQDGTITLSNSLEAVPGSQRPARRTETAMNNLGSGSRLFVLGCL